jgi:hypothetical protein
MGREAGAWHPSIFTWGINDCETTEPGTFSTVFDSKKLLFLWSFTVQMKLTIILTL